MLYSKKSKDDDTSLKEKYGNSLTAYRTIATKLLFFCIYCVASKLGLKKKKRKKSKDYRCYYNNIDFFITISWS